MDIDKTDSKIKVEIEGRRIVYDRESWTSEEKVLGSDGVETFKEWELDLINNHGVDKDELRS